MGVYVVQVLGGTERRATELIAALAEESVTDCFVPLREVMRRKDGSWTRIRERLFPGYVFVVTDNPGTLASRLRAIPMFTRLLGSGDDTFVPLTVEEVAWLHAFTEADTHTVELSHAVIEGDEVIVTSGPLKGHEALITKIDRHKRLAYLDMHMFGRSKTIRVGLEVVSKRS